MKSKRKRDTSSSILSKLFMLKELFLNQNNIIRKVVIVLLVSLMTTNILGVNLLNNSKTVYADNQSPVNPADGSGGTVPADENYSSTIHTFYSDYDPNGNPVSPQYYPTETYGPGYGPYTVDGVLQSNSQTSATTFAAGVPLGTIFIDQSKLSIEGGRTEIASKDNAIIAGLVTISGNQMGYDGTKPNAIKMVPGKINELKGDLIRVIFDNAAVLPNGDRANLVITYSNARIVIDERYNYVGADHRYYHGAVSLCQGTSVAYGGTDNTDFSKVNTAIGYTATQMTNAENAVIATAGAYDNNGPAAGGTALTFENNKQKQPVVGMTIDITYQIMDRSGVPVSGTFVYGVSGVNLDRDPDVLTNVPNRAKPIWYSMKDSFDSGKGKAHSFFSEAMEIISGQESNYVYVRPNTDIRDNPQNTTTVNWPKAEYFFANVSKTANGNIKFIGNDRNIPGSSLPNSWGGNDKSYNAGFVVLANAADGFKVTASGHGAQGGGMNSVAFNSAQIWYRYTSGSGKHGKIEITSEGNPGGNLSVGTILPGGDNKYAEDATGDEKPNTYVVTEGKTVTYTMTPDVGYKAKKITVTAADGTRTEIKFNNEAVSKMKKGDSITVDTADAPFWAAPTTVEPADPTKGKGILTYEGNGIYTFRFNHARHDEEIYVEWEPTTADILAYKIWDDDDDIDGIRFEKDPNGLPKFKLQWTKNGRDWEDVTDKMDIGLRNPDNTVKLYELKTPVTQQTVPAGKVGSEYKDGTYVINNGTAAVPDKWMLGTDEYTSETDVLNAKANAASAQITRVTEGEGTAAVTKYVYNGVTYDTYAAAYRVFDLKNPIVKIKGCDEHPFTWEYLPVYTYDRNGRADRAIQYRIVEIDDPWQYEYEKAQYYEHQNFDLTSPGSNSIEGWGLFTDGTNTYAKKGDAEYTDGLYYLVDPITGVVDSTPVPIDSQPDPDSLYGVSSSDYWTEDHAVPYHEIEAKNEHYTSDIYVDVVKFWNDEIIRRDAEQADSSDYARKAINIVLHGEIEGATPGSTSVVDLDPNSDEDDLIKTITLDEDDIKEDVTGYEEIADNDDDTVKYTKYLDQNNIEYAYVVDKENVVDGYYRIESGSINTSVGPYTFNKGAINPIKKNGDGTYKVNDNRYGAMFEWLPTHKDGKHITYTVTETDTDGNPLNEWILTGGQLAQVKDGNKLVGYETTMINTPDVDEVFVPVPVTIYKVDANSKNPLEGAEFTVYYDAGIGDAGKATQSEDLVVGTQIHNLNKNYVKQRDTSDNKDKYYEVKGEEISTTPAYPQPEDGDLVDTGEKIGNRTIYNLNKDYVIQQDSNDNKYKYYIVNNGTVETSPADPQPIVSELTENGKLDGDDAYTDGTNNYVIRDNKYHLVDPQGNVVGTPAYPQPDPNLISNSPEDRAKDLKTGQVDKNVIVTDSNGYATFNFLIPNDDERQLYYYVKETKAPEGYNPDPKTYAFRIDADLKTITLEDPDKDHANHWWQKLYELIFGTTPESYTNWVKDGDNRGGTLTVEDTPIIADILVRKYWNDNNDQDGKRPGDKNDPTATTDSRLPKVTLQYTIGGHTANGSNVYQLAGTDKKYVHNVADDKYYEVIKEDVVGTYSGSAATTQPTSTTATSETAAGLTVYKDESDNKYVIIDKKYHDVIKVDEQGQVASTPATNQPDPNLLNLVMDGTWENAYQKYDLIPPGYEQPHVSYVGGPVLTHQNDAYTWTNLPAYLDGKVVTYRVLEEGTILDDHTYDIESNHTSQTHEKTFNLVTFNASGDPAGLNQTVDVTNKHETQVVNIEVYKTWEDYDKDDRSTAKLYLYKVVEGIEYPVTAEGDQGIYEDTGIVPVEIEIDETTGEAKPIKVWNDLPTYEGGKPVTYRLREEKIEGYITLYEAKYKNAAGVDVEDESTDIVAENIKRTFYEQGDTLPPGKIVGNENTKAKYEIKNERSVNIKVDKTWVNGANASVTFELWRTITPESELTTSAYTKTDVDSDDPNVYYVRKTIIITPEEYEELSYTEKANYQRRYVNKTNDKDILTPDRWNKIENEDRKKYEKKYQENGSDPAVYITVDEFTNLSPIGQSGYTLEYTYGTNVINQTVYEGLAPEDQNSYFARYVNNNDPTDVKTEAEYNALSAKGQNDYTVKYVNKTDDTDVISEEDYNNIPNVEQEKYAEKYVDDNHKIVSKDEYEQLSPAERSEYDIEQVTSWSPYEGGGKDGTTTVDGWELVEVREFDANSFVNPSPNGDKKSYTFNDLLIKDDHGNTYTYRILEKPSLLRFRENQVSDTQVINNNVNVSDGNVVLEVVKEIDGRDWMDNEKVKDQFYFYLEPVKGVDVTDTADPKDISSERVPMPYRIDPATTAIEYNYTADATMNDLQVGAIGRAATFEAIQYKENSALYHSIGRGDVVEFYYRVYEIYDTKEETEGINKTITADKSLDHDDATTHSGYLNGITYTGDVSKISQDDYDGLDQYGKDSYRVVVVYVNNNTASDVKSAAEYDALTPEQKDNYHAETRYANKYVANDVKTQAEYEALSEFGQNTYSKVYVNKTNSNDTKTQAEYDLLTDEEKANYKESIQAFLPTVHEAKVIVKNVDGIITTETQWLKGGKYQSINNPETVINQTAYDALTPEQQANYREVFEYVTGAVPVYTNTYSSQGYAKAWIEKRISNRPWVDYDNDKQTGDAFSYKVESISGSALNVPGASSDSYTSRPLMSNETNNPQTDIQKMSNNEYAFGLRGNKYDNTMLNSDGYAYFIYEISENPAVNYSDENFTISNHTVDGLEYDTSKIYAKLRAEDQWDGTISFTVEYFTDASCKNEYKINNHKAWIYDDDTETEAGKRLLTMTQAAQAKAMTEEQRKLAHYREINVAYFTNYESIDIPVKKEWVDGPAIEDVNLHLEVHKFDLSTVTDEDDIDDDYVKRTEDRWNPSENNNEPFWQTAGYTHYAKRGEFLEDDGTPKYDEGSTNTSSNTYVDIKGFNLNLPKYEHTTDEHGNETTYLLVYRLLEDDTSNTYTQSYKSIKYTIISPEEHEAITDETEKAKYQPKYVNNDNDKDVIDADDYNNLNEKGKSSYTKEYTDGTTSISEAEYIALPEKGSDSYSSTTAYANNDNPEDIISEEEFIALDPSAQAEYTRTNAYTDGEELISAATYNGLPEKGQNRYTVQYTDGTTPISESEYDELTDKGQNDYTQKYIKENPTEGDYIYTDGDTLVVTNIITAHNKAKPAAVKQLLGRDWLDSDDFKFILTPVGRYDKDGAFVETTDIPMPLSDEYVNKNTGEVISKDDYNNKADKGKDSYDEVIKGYKETSTESVISVDYYIGLTPEEQANYEPIKQFVNKKDSSDVITDITEYNGLPDVSKDSYKPKEINDEAHAKITDDEVDTEGHLERLAKFGDIEFTTNDLVYNDIDKYYHGDFFYTMKEDIPAGVYAVNKETLEKVDNVTLSDTNRNDYYWKDPTTGIIYDGSVHTVHIQVKENRSDELQVQVSYAETEQGNIKTGKQFTPVFTNRYDTSLILAQEVDKYIMGRNWKVGDVFDFRMTAMSSAPFVDGDPKDFPDQDTHSDEDRERELAGGKAIHSARGAHVKRLTVTSETVNNEIQTVLMPKLKFELSDLHKVVENENTLKYSDGTYVAKNIAYDQFIYSFEETNDYLDQHNKAVKDLSIDGDTEYIRITIIDTGKGTLDYYTEVFEDRYCTVPRTIPGTDDPAINPTFVNQLKRDLTIEKTWTDPATSDITLRLQWSIDGGTHWYDVDDAEWLPSYVRTTQTIKKGAFGDDLIKIWYDLPAYANIVDAQNQKGDEKALNDLWVYYRIVEDDIDHVITRYSYDPYDPTTGEDYNNTDKYKTKEALDSPRTETEGKVETYNPVTPATDANPKANAWYEKNNEDKYVLTPDIKVQDGKTYYTKHVSYETTRRDTLYVTNWPKDLTGEARVGVVKQFIGKDWKDEEFTFQITPVESMIGSETTPVGNGKTRIIVNYTDGNYTISQAEYNTLPDKGKDSYTQTTAYQNTEGEHEIISAETYGENPRSYPTYVEITAYTDGNTFITEDAYNKLPTKSKSSYVEVDTPKTNVMPAYNKTNADKTKANIRTDKVSVNEHSADFDPLTIKLTDLAVDYREKITVEGVEKANPNFGKAGGTFFYKVKEVVEEPYVEVVDGTGTDAKTYYVKDNIKYTTEEHIVKIVAVDDGSGEIDITVSYDDREHGEYVPVYTNYAMYPTPITGEKDWVGGKESEHVNGTVTIDENDANKITESTDALKLQLQRKIEGAEGNPTGLDTDDAGRDLVIVWAKDNVTETPGAIINYTYSEDGEHAVEPIDPKTAVQIEEAGCAICDGETITTNCYIPNEIEKIVTHSLEKYETGDGWYTVMAIDSNGNYVDPILNKVNADGYKYVYSIKENEVPENYADTYEGLKVTNTSTLNDDLKVVKVWDDAQNTQGLRPTKVVLHLYRLDTNKNIQVEVEAKEITNGKEATGITWTDLPLYDEQGNEITYVVIEESIAGYTIAYTTKTNPQDSDYTASDNKLTLDGEDGAQTIIVKNSLAQEVSTVTVTKDWKDENNKDKIRPVSPDGVTLALYEHVFNTSTGQYGDATLVTTRPATQADVDADTSGNTKLGDDITVEKLFLDGVVDSPQDLVANETEAWKGSWINLPSRKNGRTVIYEVRELVADNTNLFDSTNPEKRYTAIVTGDQVEGFTVTNTHVPQRVYIDVTKNWNDESFYNNPNYSRIGLTFTLTAKAGDTDLTATQLGKTDTDMVKTIAANATGADLSVRFTDFPRYYNGTEIVYTVTETASDPSANLNLSSWTVSGGTLSAVNDINTGILEGYETTFTNTPKGAEEVDQLTLNIFKKDKIGEGPLKNAVFTITKKGEPDTETDITTGDNGIATYTITSPGTYYVKEKTAPEGYELDTTRYEFVVDKNLEKIELKQDIWTKLWELLFNKLDNPFVQDATNEKLYTLTLGNTSKVSEIAVNKLWKDSNNQDGTRVKTIAYTLVAKDSEGNDITGALGISDTTKNMTRIDVTEDDEAVAGTMSWTNLPTHYNGSKVKYTITETAPNGYRVSYDANENLELSDTATTTVNATNTYEALKTKVTVNKVWEDSDNQDGKRPTSVEVKLYKVVGNARTLVNTKTLNAASEWTDEWTNLPVKEKGTTIEYYVVESPITDYEIKANSDNGYDKRKTAVPISTENPDGTGIFVITNVHELETADIKVTKVWDDNNNQDGKRADVNATVQLEAKATNETNWSTITGKNANVPTTNGDVITWTELPLYKEGEKGIAINYRVVETIGQANSEYTKSGDSSSLTLINDEETVVTITNSYTPIEGYIKVTKNWDDKNNTYQERKATKVHLYKTVDGVTKHVETLSTSEIITTDDGYTTTFGPLPAYENGKLITYTVVEEDVHGYKTTITQNGVEGINLTRENTSLNPALVGITNSHPEEVEITLTKIWDDDNNADNTRPTLGEFASYITLLADGQDVTVANANKLTTSESGNTYTLTWKRLARKTDGITPTDIEYKVKETLPRILEDIYVPSSTTALTVTWDTDHEKGTATITNSSKTYLEVEKVWLDNNNQDNKRPDSVTVQLLADGESVSGKTLILNESNKWTGKFTDLPISDNGTKIVYTVIETTVLPEGYQVSYDNTVAHKSTVINSYNPEKITIEATKVWDEDSEETAKVGETMRKDVTFHLIGKQENGKIAYIADPITIEKDSDDLTVTWSNLPKYIDKQLLVWEVYEDAVYGYKTEISGDSTAGFVVTNIYNDPQTEIKAKKIWDDNSNQDGIRPPAVTFELWEIVGSEDPAPVANSRIELNKFNGNESSGDYDVDEDDNMEVKDGYAIWSNLPTTKLVESTEEITNVVYELYEDNTGPLNKLSEADYNALIEDDVTQLEKDWRRKETTEIVVTSIDENAVVYFVKETGSIDEYESQVTVNDDGEFVVYNRHTPETINIPVIKVWADSNNAKGLRPDHITVYLYADDELKDTLVITSPMNNDSTWIGKFSDLDRYVRKDISGEGEPENIQSVPIVYEIKEDEIDQYNTSITVFDPEEPNGSITITNTVEDHPLITVKAKKVFDHGSNPEPATSATFILMKDGVDVADSAITLSEFEKNDETGHYESVDDDDGVIGDDPIIMETIDGYAVWADLYTHNPDGTTVKWSVREEAITDYATTISTPTDKTEYDEISEKEIKVYYITITNTYVKDVHPVVTYVDPLNDAIDMIIKANLYTTTQDASTAANTRTDAPEDPKHNGYRFTGWDLDWHIDSGYILVAKYEKSIITYIDPLSSEPIIKSLYSTDPDSSEVPDNPSHSGYKFVGWVETEDADGNKIYVAKYACQCSDSKPCPVYPSRYKPPRTSVH